MKIFECKPICRNKILESIVISCQDCIKKHEFALPEKERKAIEKVLKALDNNFFRFK